MSHNTEYTRGFDDCLALAVAALSEAVPDGDKVVNLLQKLWDLPREEAQELLAYERTQGFLHRDFLMFLMQYKGFSQDSALSYVNSHVTLDAVRRIDRPWAMENQKLYDAIEKQKKSIRPALKHPARLMKKTEV